MNQVADASQVEEELELDLAKYSALLLGQLMRCELQHCLLAAGLKEEREENTVNIAGFLDRTPFWIQKQDFSYMLILISWSTRCNQDKFKYCRYQCNHRKLRKFITTNVIQFQPANLNVTERYIFLEYIYAISFYHKRELSGVLFPHFSSNPNHHEHIQR